MTNSLYLHLLWTRLRFDSFTLRELSAPVGQVARTVNPPSLSLVESAALQLDEAQADFLTHHVSILIGSCNQRCEPSVARAYGCRVAADRRSITVFLAVAQAEAVIKDLRGGGGIAAVFSRPTSHRTLQLKGSRADIAALEPGDRELMRRYGKSFAEEVESIGFGASFGTSIMSGCEAEAVAVRFVPIAAFEQTPGPSAGQPLSAAS